MKFNKMHGAGNDFVVFDGRTSPTHVELIRTHTPDLCHRRTGIGADGVLVLGLSDHADYTMHYFNADGSLAGMCGNGARCLALFATELGFPDHLSFEAAGKRYTAGVYDTHVSVRFPVTPTPEPTVIDGTPWIVLNTGTEHVVSVNAAYKEASNDQFRQTGRRIRNRTDLFAKGTNVNFAYATEQNRLQLVTYERGVEDLTLACGTGAIATALAWDYCKRTDHKACEADAPAFTEALPLFEQTHSNHMQLDCPGGLLEVSFDLTLDKTGARYDNIILHGPAVRVFDGHIQLP